MSPTVPRYVVVQNAYVVDDLDKAIDRFTRHGYGPPDGGAAAIMTRPQWRDT
jgi:hypothetical protein